MLLRFPLGGLPDYEEKEIEVQGVKEASRRAAFVVMEPDLPQGSTDFLFQSLSNERSAAFAASHAADIGRVDVELLRDSLVNASENGNCTQ
jgi:hypothetical protein